MDADLTTLIRQVRQGTADAYEPIVQRFQDMAVGYGYARLGDLQLAEDAAQEAFLTAYLALPTLREPAAFPGWFRRILIKHIDRIHRRRRAMLSIDVLAHVAAAGQNPVDLVEHQELHAVLVTALQCLPVAQREVVTLFYMGAHSHVDISAFLAIPVSTVKMRLYHARTRLAQQLVDQLAEYLPTQRPSRDSTFKEHVMSYPVHTKDVAAQPIISLTRECFSRCQLGRARAPAGGAGASALRTPPGGSALAGAVNRAAGRRRGVRALVDGAGGRSEARGGQAFCASTDRALGPGIHGLAAN